MNNPLEENYVGVGEIPILIKRNLIRRSRRNSCNTCSSIRIFWLVLLFSLSVFLFHCLFVGWNNERFTFLSPNNSNLNGNDQFFKVEVDDELSSSYAAAAAYGTNNTTSDSISCSGRYIYIHHLPTQFNQDVLKNCNLLTRPTDKFSMCTYIANLGLGPPITNSDQHHILSNNSWYSTNQFLLELIFHNRMKNYQCLTPDSSLASAIYVPAYIGLHLRRYLWRFSTSMRDSSGVKLVKWLSQQPQWEKMSGRDHFLVAGRISRDFRRQSDRNSDWGSKFRFLPESENMSMLTIESGTWSNDFAIPYPTYFHPSTDAEILQWQNRMRRQTRPYLFSFAGAQRSRQKGSVRDEIIRQCIAASDKSSCKLLDCDSKARECDNPVNLMNLFQTSVFCLQPPGDSFTRRSTFDSILAGCIPVFFDPRSAYSQYKWHLPKNHTTYSVLLSSRDLRLRKVLINETLGRVSVGEQVAIREEVIKLIPSIVYADPKSRLETTKDAFDLAVKGVLDKIKRAS